MSCEWVQHICHDTSKKEEKKRHHIPSHNAVNINIDAPGTTTSSPHTHTFVETIHTQTAARMKEGHCQYFSLSLSLSLDNMHAARRGLLILTHTYTHVNRTSRIYVPMFLRECLLLVTKDFAEASGQHGHLGRNLLAVPPSLLWMSVKMVKSKGRKRDQIQGRKCVPVCVAISSCRGDGDNDGTLFFRWVTRGVARDTIVCERVSSSHIFSSGLIIMRSRPFLITCLNVLQRCSLA